MFIFWKCVSFQFETNETKSLIRMFISSSRTFFILKLITWHVMNIACIFQVAQFHLTVNTNDNFFCFTEMFNVRWSMVDGWWPFEICNSSQPMQFVFDSEWRIRYLLNETKQNQILALFALDNNFWGSSKYQIYICILAMNGKHSHSKQKKWNDFKKRNHWSPSINIAFTIAIEGLWVRH